MKLFFVFYLLLFSLNAEAWRMPWEREDPGPLREIRIRGSYTPEDERELRELKESEEYYREIGFLEENEALKDKYPFVNYRYGEERFGFSNNYTGFKYCHTKLPEKWKYKFTVDPKLRDPNLSTPDLRVRLYDGRGNFLSEDRLRSGEYEIGSRFTWIVEAYSLSSGSTKNKSCEIRRG